MKIPEHWLRAHCDPDMDTDALAHGLTMAGLEVESVSSVAPPFNQVVLARIISAEPHPAADRLQVCQVEVAPGVVRHIVCGAPNARSGLWTACALPGAILPGGVAIAKASMRGVVSEGMLCSGKELGLGDDHSGILELNPEEHTSGYPIRALLNLDEAVFELKVTPNLAHCMSVLGVARELSAITGAPLKLQQRPKLRETISDTLRVRIDAPELCGRFAGRVIRNVDASILTPHWIKQRLERAGQRSVSILVDLSNYLLLELGRPTHIFDLDRLDGNELVVRWGQAGEQADLLNGQQIDVSPRGEMKVGVIVDQSRVESLAGIMGGSHSAVETSTSNIFVEAAFWWGTAIAGRPRIFNFTTEAAQRYERGVDADSIPEHLDLLCALIQELCGGEIGPRIDEITALPKRPAISLRIARLQRVTGMEIRAQDAFDSLKRLDLAPKWSVDPGSNQNAGTLVVNPPSWRFDLAIEEDLIEEVLRLIGFDSIPVRPITQPIKMLPADESLLTPNQIKRRWVGRGYQEVVNFSFIDRQDHDRFNPRFSPISLKNPIAEHFGVMRTELWSGLLGVLQRNLNRRVNRAKIFEVGRVYWSDPFVSDGPNEVAGICQPMRLGALLYGPSAPDQWSLTSRTHDFFDLKGDLEELHPEVQWFFEPDSHPALHPGQSARIRVMSTSGPIDVGWVGALHPKLISHFELLDTVILAEVDFASLQVRDVPKFEELSRFPSATRDLALVLDEDTAAGSVLSEIREFCSQDAATQYVKSVSIFDLYRGKGLENKEKSLAIRFWMQDTHRTLSDTEIDQAMAKVVDFASVRFGSRLR